jgi:hypothetical protein
MDPFMTAFLVVNLTFQTAGVTYILSKISKINALDVKN